jgi:hypothetical protein
MTMYLKSGDNLSIENPSSQQFLEIFSKIEDKSFCLSKDRRVGNVYSEYAEELLEIKRKTSNSYQISIQKKIKPHESYLQTLQCEVDLSTAVKIACAYSKNEESWKHLTQWKEKEESILSITKAFFNIVLEKSLGKIIVVIATIAAVIGIAIFFKSNFSISEYFKNMPAVKGLSTVT